MATESGRDETGDETSGPGDETGGKTATTAGEDRDGGDKKSFFSCCLVCISMTRAFRCQYALENKAGISASDAWC